MGMVTTPSHFYEFERQVDLCRFEFLKIKPEQMLVAHDELDFPPGAVRLKFDGGHGGQNGLRDITKLSLVTDVFIVCV